MTDTPKPTIDLTHTAKEITRLYELITKSDQTIADASKSILEHRIEIGEMLISVKATDYGKHGKWELWLEINCPTVPLSTARLCMQLAKNQDTLKQRAAEIDNAVSDLSIRAARKLLAKPKTEGTGGGTPKTPRTPKATGKGAVEPAPQDPESIVEALEADEVESIISRKWDEEKRDLLRSKLSASLKDLLHDIAPDELATALREADWGKEQVQELIKILTSRLAPSAEKPALGQRNPPPQAEGTKGI
jgi:hypothetical protein